MLFWTSGVLLDVKLFNATLVSQMLFTKKTSVAKHCWRNILTQNNFFVVQTQYRPMFHIHGEIKTT